MTARAVPAGGPRRLSRRRAIAQGVTLVWASESLTAVVAVFPAACLVRTALADDPESDARLLRDGSRALLWLLSRNAPGVTAAAETAALVFAVGGFAVITSWAALMFLLASPPARPRWFGIAGAVSAALRALPAFVGLLLAFAVAQAITIGAGVGLGVLVAALAHDGLGEARSDQIGAAVACPFVIATVWLGLVQDLARVAIVRFRMAPLPALVAGFQTFGRRPWALTFSFGWRAAGALGAIAIASAVIGWRGTGGLLGLLLAALIHQTVVIGRILFRTSWLAVALSAGEERGRSAHIGAPDRPSPGPSA